jgi:TolA-binding protein
MSGMFSNRYFRWYLTALVALILSTGCVYYNTFFMARKKFNEAEKKQAQNTEDKKKQGIPPGQPRRPGGDQGRGNVDRRGGSPSGSFTTKVSPQVRILYEDAIKKASKVLTYHPESKWIDDALWLIGKSYYNMGEYLQADRKFKELVTNHPESKFADDSFYYKGLCQIELGHSNQAMEAFDRIEGISRKSEYIDDVYFARGRIAKDDGRCSEAIELFDLYLEKYPKEDSAARAKFYIGECTEQMGNSYEAYIAYSDVNGYKPSKQLRFDATLAAASAVLKTDSVSIGMEILTDLAKDERYFEQSARIRLKIAEGHYLQNQIEEAINEYNRITEQSPKSHEAAEAYYRLGLIYQNDLFDLEKAKESFSKAQTENPSSEFRNLALARSAQIAKLESYQVQLQRADSVRAAELFRAQNPEDYPDSITSPEISGEDIIGPVELRDSSFIGPSLPEGAESDPIMVEAEEIFTVPIETMGELVDVVDGADTAGAPGEDSAKVEKGEYYTVPLESAGVLLIGPVDEDTTLTAIGPDSLNRVNRDPGESQAGKMSVEDSVRAAHAARLERIRQDKIRQDSIKQEIERTGIDARFLLAELYAYELNRPDSALHEYLLIADQHPNSEYAPRSLLACASLEIDRGDSAVAEEYLYRLIEDHPRSPQAAAAAEMLSYQLDLSENALGLYSMAESLAYDGVNLDSAITLFRHIEGNFPDLAPKASYAVAWAMDRYQEDEDSSAYHAYKIVGEQYPQSIYAVAARDRMGLMAKAVRRRVSPPEEKREEIEIVEADADSLRMIAQGLPPAPAVKELGEFEYPRALLGRRLKGEVLFKIKINLFGKVEEHEIIGPSGEYAIDSAATVALLDTEFDTSDLDFAKLDKYYKYVIGFERPDINIFNDPYIEERRQGP